jgi:DNA-directed RNA polymerase specialized sigma24 family protein
VTVSTDLAEMLRTEMEYLYEDRARTDAKIEAITLLLETHTRPTTTFTADAAREHDARKHDADVPSKPRKARSTRKSLRVGLSAAELSIIRSRAAEGESYEELAGEFSVSRSTIGNIVTRQGCYE